MITDTVRQRRLQINIYQLAQRTVYIVSIGEMICMAQETLPRYEEKVTDGKAGHVNMFGQCKHLDNQSILLGRADSERAGYSCYKKVVIMRSIKLFYVIWAVALFAVLWTAFYPDTIDNWWQGLLDTEIIVNIEVFTWTLYAILIIRLGRTFHAYETGAVRITEIIYSQLLTNFFGAAIIFILMCMTRQYLINPLPLFAIVSAQGVWSAVWGISANKLYFCLYPPRPTVIIYKTAADLKKIEQIRFFSNRFDVQERIENPDDFDMVFQAINSIKAVIITGVDASLRNKVVCHCFEEGIQCFVTPEVSDIIMARAEHLKTFCTPIMHVRRAQPSPEYLFIKRAFDIVGSMLGILLASPFMIFTALAIKVYDGGPVLYRQVRLTKGRQKFEILKFRSMCVDAEKDGVARLACICDDRITPVGKVIRTIRFDELPQLFNILRGDMSVVGPRPERPEIVDQYEDVVPEFYLRLQVKAGLTGYAQVYGKYNTEPADKLHLDLMYMNHISFAEDMKIILYTIKILLLPESTEGVEFGKQTVMENKK